MHQLLFVVVGGALVNHIGRGLQRFQGKNDRTQAFSAKRSMVHIDTGAGVGGYHTGSQCKKVKATQ